jgi:hypothetical protein
MRALMIVCLALFVAACSSTTGEVVDPTRPPPEVPKNDMGRPEGVLKELYTSYFTVLNSGGESQAGNYVDKYFQPELAAKYAAVSGKPESPINFDVFINAQDHKELTLGVLKRAYENPERAVYEVHFTNNDDPAKVKVALIKVGGTWQITDIDYGQAVTLSGLLK